MSFASTRNILWLNGPEHFTLLSAIGIENNSRLVTISYRVQLLIKKSCTIIYCRIPNQVVHVLRNNQSTISSNCANLLPT